MIKHFLILGLFLVIASKAFAAQGPEHTDYETVGAGVTAQTLGPVGGAGDVLDRLVVHAGTAASATVTIIDGAYSYAIVPANTTIGVYSVLVGARSVSGPWKITTGAGASVMAIGRFK